MVRLGGHAPGPAAAMKIYDYGFASRLVHSGDIGIAEAYLRGEWETTDLTHFLQLFCVNHELIAADAGGRGRWCGPGSSLTALAERQHQERRSRRNIHAHYDLGNRFSRRGSTTR